MAKNEETRTAAFTCLALVSLIAAGATYWMNRPPKLDDFELVGQPFFAEFKESSQATSLEVVAMGDDANVKKFSVKEVDGLWTIPSHHNYPAEAVARLASTSSSVIGLGREALAGRLKSEFEKFGVVDPKDSEATDSESVGKRLTLLDSEGEVLADFIIGKQVKDIPQQDSSFREYEEEETTKPYYYVRRADENQTYRVQLNVDLSTRFSDWIEPDLLKIKDTQLTKVFLDNYKVDERAGDVLGQTKELMKIPGQQLTFQRSDGTSDWELEGLRPQVETFNTARLQQITDVLDNIEIVGVRPKMTFMDKQLLTADLDLNQEPEFEKDRQGYGRALNELRYEMGDKGFNLISFQQPDGTTKLDLFCRRGELMAGTDEGVVYTLMFGNEVSGDDQEIEMGSHPKEDKEEEEEEEDTDTDSDETEQDDKADAEADSETDTESSETEKSNRYLMISVSLDESLLGTKPEKPVEPPVPVKPEGYKPEAPESEDVDETSGADDETDSEENNAPKPDNEGEESESESETEDAEDKEGDGEDEGDSEEPQEDEERDPAFAKYEMELAVYEELQVKYELDLDRYKNELKDWGAKVEAGQKRVDELHERFNKWYYVISADNLDAVKGSRSDFVTQTNPPKPLPERPRLDFPIPAQENLNQ